MLSNLKRNLYFARLNLLYDKGLKDGSITFFDEEFYEKMGSTYFNTIPVSIHIKYLKPLLRPGKCYDRSLFMFFCFDDALLVRADKKSLEYQYGKSDAGHGWIEIGDYVYDPSLMLKFDKSTYLKEHKEFVDKHVSHSLDDFKPGGERRLELGVLIIQLRELSNLIDDEEFNREFEEYLDAIEYDEAQIQKEREIAIQKILNDKKAMACISGN